MLAEPRKPPPPGAETASNQVHKSKLGVMPRFSVTSLYPTCPAMCTGPVLLPPSRIVFGSIVISSPSRSENVAEQTMLETPTTSISTRKLNVVKGTSVAEADVPKPMLRPMLAMSRLQQRQLSAALHKLYGQELHGHRGCDPQ